MFALVLLGQLAVVWVTPIKPLPDLGFHLAAASVARHLGEPGNRFAQFYHVDQGLKPNTLNLRWDACPLLPGVFTADQLFYSVYVLATAGLVLLILRTIGAAPWYALLSVPLLYNYSVAYGFTEFTAAIPLCLVLWYVLIRWEKADHAGWRVAAAGALAGVYLAHAMAAVFALMVFAAFVGWHYRGRWGAMAGNALWALPAAAMLVGWYLLSPSGGAADSLGWLVHYYEAGYLAGLPDRALTWVTSSNHALVGPLAGPMIAAAMLAGILAVCAAGLLRARRGRGEPSEDAGENSPGAGTPAAVWAWLGVCGFVVLLAPPGLPPYWSVYQRFICFFVLGLIVWSAGANGEWSPGRKKDGAGRRAMPGWAIGLAIALAGAHTVLWFDHMWGFRREASDLRQVAKGVSNDHVVGVWIGASGYRGEPEAFNHAGDYLTVLRRAVVVSQLYDFPFTAVRRAVGESRLPKMDSVRGRGPGAYADMTAIQQVVVHGPLPTSSRFRAAFELTRDAGRWRLYERRSASGDRR